MREESDLKCLHILLNWINYLCWPNQPQWVIVGLVDRQRDIFDILSCLNKVCDKANKAKLSMESNLNSEVGGEFFAHVLHWH